MVKYDLLPKEKEKEKDLSIHCLLHVYANLNKMDLKANLRIQFL